jgi:hypothetical protein
MRRTRLAAVGTDPRETGVGKPSAHTSCTSVPEAYKEAALAALTTTVVPLTGQRYDNLLTAANASDDAETGDGVLLLVRTAGTITTVTLVTPETVDGDLAVADRTVATVATGDTMIKLTNRYRDPATGRCTIQFSPTTSVTRCVVRV